MRLIGDLLFRVLVVGFALTVAVAAAGMFLGYNLYSEMVRSAQQSGSDPVIAGIFAFLIGLFASPFYLAATFAPALGVILLAEFARLRGIISNILLGGFAAFMAYWLSKETVPGEQIANATMVILLATGFIGGFFYWLIAGRSAGGWLDRLDDQR